MEDYKRYSLLGRSDKGLARSLINLERRKMKEYHKIQSVFKRDPANNMKTFLLGEYSKPEFKFLKDNAWVWTEKVDGTNIRVMWNGKDVIFGGKTDNAQIPSFLVTALNERFNTITAKQKLKEIFKEEEVCLYGEGYGAKIQKGGGNYKSDGNDFVLFDVKIGKWWLQRKDVKDVADQLGVDDVPVISEGTLKDAVETVKKGFNSRWGEFRAEGIVLRPEVEFLDRAGRRIITKLKHKDFKET